MHTYCLEGVSPLAEDREVLVGLVQFRNADGTKPRDVVRAFGIENREGIVYRVISVSGDDATDRLHAMLGGIGLVARPARAGFSFVVGVERRDKPRSWWSRWFGKPKKKARPSN